MILVFSSVFSFLSVSHSGPLHAAASFNIENLLEDTTERCMPFIYLWIRESWEL